MATECLICGCPRWQYISACDGCEARMQYRIGTKAARQRVVDALRAIEARSGRELAERVKKQAMEQR